MKTNVYKRFDSRMMESKEYWNQPWVTDDDSLCAFKQVDLRNKSNNGLAQNKDSVTEWNN